MKYHLVVKRNGKETRLTDYPMSHKKCMVMRSKQSDETIKYVSLKPVIGAK